MTNRKTVWISWAFAAALMSGIVACPLASRMAMAQPREHNPRLHRAMEALREAEKELNEARHTYHGHKQEAITAVHHAIEQLDIIKDIEND